MMCKGVPFPTVACCAVTTFVLPSSNKRRNGLLTIRNTFAFLLTCLFFFCFSSVFPKNACMQQAFDAHSKPHPLDLLNKAQLLKDLNFRSIIESLMRKGDSYRCRSNFSQLLYYDFVLFVFSTQVWLSPLSKASRLFQ